MQGIPTVWLNLAIDVLQPIGLCSSYLDYLIGALPFGHKLPSWFVFLIFEDPSKNPVSLLEGPSSDSFVVAFGDVLMVGPVS